MMIECPGFGFRFAPSDEILLKYYLFAKVRGEKLPCNMVEEKEIYGPHANPWHLFDSSSMSWTDFGKCEKTVYIFTRLTKKAASPTDKKTTEHYVRKAGCGTWHDETGRKQIMVRDGENVIRGNKKLLVYQINDTSGLGDGIKNSDDVGYWKMHEYCLDGFEDYVLCAITWDTSKKAKVVSSKMKAKIVSSKKTEVVSLCTNTLSRSQSDPLFTSNDDSAKVGNVDPRLLSEKNSRFPDLGLLQDNYVVQDGSVNWMDHTDCTPLASTSCSNNVSSNDIFRDLDQFLSDFSQEELENLDLLPDLSVEEFLSVVPSSTPNDNNNEQHPLQKCSSSQVLGKRKSTEAEHSGKKLCI